MVLERQNATDPKDYLYRILNIATETHNLHPYPDLIAPSYSKSIMEVYYDLAKYLLAYDGLSHNTYMGF